MVVLKDCKNISETTATRVFLEKMKLKPDEEICEHSLPTTGINGGPDDIVAWGGVRLSSTANEKVKAYPGVLNTSLEMPLKDNLIYNRYTRSRAI